MRAPVLRRSVLLVLGLLATAHAERSTSASSDSASGTPPAPPPNDPAPSPAPPPSKPAPSAASTRFEAVVHVAEADGRPVADAAYLAQQWARAAALLGTASMAFSPRAAPPPRSPLPRNLVTRADRDALARHAVPGVLNVFVVESLADVDEPGRERMGVHWRAAGTHYVIVATYAVPGGRACPPQYACGAAPGLLAHELGHFFGLGHDSRSDNLMSYTRAGAALWLDEAQRTRLEAGRRRELGRGLRRVQPSTAGD